MICTKYNADIRKLINNKHILWKCYLSDNTEVWSDFYNEKDPWVRLKEYCTENKIDINKVTVLVIGAKEETVFEDSDGLDGIFIIRGIIKDLFNPDSTEYKYMAFGKINTSTSKIDVVKYYWPQCDFDSYKEIREITPENLKLMFLKSKKCKDSCQCQKNKQKKVDTDLPLPETTAHPLNT